MRFSLSFFLKENKLFLAMMQKKTTKKLVRPRNPILNILRNMNRIAGFP